MASRGIEARETNLSINSIHYVHRIMKDICVYMCKIRKFRSQPSLAVVPAQSGSIQINVNSS